MTNITVWRNDETCQLCFKGVIDDDFSVILDPIDRAAVNDIGLFKSMWDGKPVPPSAWLLGLEVLMRRTEEARKKREAKQ